MPGATRAHQTRYTSSPIWYHRFHWGETGKLRDRDSHAMVTRAPHTRCYKSRPKSATQHPWAFALSPAHIKYRWQHGRRCGCKSPEERQWVIAASQLPSWGLHVTYDSLVATRTHRQTNIDRHTELLQASYTVQHIEHCLQNGLDSWYSFSPVDQMRNLKPTYLPSIQPDK